MDDGCHLISKRPKLELDPDYEQGYDLEAERRCLVEESGQGQAQQRVLEAVVRELDLALPQKESEVLEIQQRVQGCQQALNVLRMGVSSAFYKNRSDPEAPVDCPPKSEGDTALHPAVSRLVKCTTASGGHKTQGFHNKYSTNRPPEADDDTSAFQEGISDAENKCTDEGKTQERCGSENENEEEEEKDEMREEPTHVKVPRYIPPLLPKPPEVCAASTRMERLRIKRRLVVGNVSKWLPEDVREDASSHKWMLYLRGTKDSPDLCDVVAKVRYFLHPSYRPHDIVDVVHPFYLARRGWGEFPVRVQVHFAFDGNRPIDIIHNLKLDRTYSGLQTLGGETVVDVWLKNVPSNQCVEQSNVQCCQKSIQKLSSTESSNTIFCNGQHEIAAHAAGRQPSVVSLVTKQVKKEKMATVEDAKQKGRQLDKEHKITVKEEKVHKITVKEEKVHKITEGTKEEPEEDGGILQNDKMTPRETSNGTPPDTQWMILTRLCENVEKRNSLSQQCKRKKDSSEQYHSLRNRCVVHTLPDHDYLGNYSFKLKCDLCVDQRKLHCLSDVKPLKKEITEKETFSEHTFVNATKIEAVAKVDNGSKSMVSSNGVLSESRLVQCVDSAGNILYIGLQKPIVSKNELQKDTKMKICNQKTSIENVNVSQCVAVRAGQSLLKKNCGVPPLSPSSEKCCPSRLSEVVQPKLISEKSHSQLQKVEIKPDTYNLLKMATLMVPRISDDCRAVMWLLRQLPLADKRVVKDTEYKEQHPYCASNVANFLAWPVGKRHYAERLRAKEVHSILQEIDSHRFTKWSVRHIMKWSRLHALTPLPLGKCIEQVEKTNLSASSLKPSVSEPSEVQDWLESIAEASKTAEEMEDVNVVDVPASTGFMSAAPKDHTSNCVTVWVPSKSDLLKFVQETVRQIDIQLVAEALSQGVLYPAAEELLYRACLSFSEDLLRRSVRQAWKRCQQMPNEVVLADVQNALLSHSEFDILTNTGLGVQTYASKLV